ncbi:MAG: C10 family peptidase [Victivallales bacterium]|nr:C10 family peptidase [Victivallales bacterium]
MQPIGRKLCSIVCLLVAFSFPVLHATEVSENEILAAAKKWIATNAVFLSELPDAVPAKVVHLADFEGKGMPLWRVDLKPTGYLIMSADDTLPPVVAFDTKSSFNMPAGHPLHAMLKRQGEIFQNELSKPQMRGDELALQNRMRWNTLLGRTRADDVMPSTIVTQPLLATAWHQDSPYNFFCPSGDTYGERAITGCVAVAVAQLLKYHEWPPSGKGVKTFSDNESDIQATMKADYSFPYDWSLMTDEYAAGMDEKNYGGTELSVARLVMEASVLVEADYDLDNTTAFSHDVHQLMAQYLGYSDSAVYGDSRQGYIGYISQSTLYSRIRADIAAGYPAIVGFEGHAFIADGLGTMEGQDYYHFNYGWGGLHDGWYLLTDGFENDVVICATTNIRPSPVAVFKPMSCEQTSSFTLSWDFPKRLSAQAFRLTKTTGTRAYEIISDSIDGTARSYNLTGQSGTAAYTLEAKVNGSWQAVSDSMTVTVKTDPAAMLELIVDDNLKSIGSSPVTTMITANHSLANLTVTSSRPDILSSSGISVTGSGASRTVTMTPVQGKIGNVLLYLTAVDTAGNTVKKTVLLRVMEDEPLVWHTVKEEAFSEAMENDKVVLMLAGIDGDVNTSNFRNKICETRDIKANLLENYVLWYVDANNSHDYIMYADGLGHYLPFIAIINPADSENRLSGYGGPVNVEEARQFLDPDSPFFNLSDIESYTIGVAQELTMATIHDGLEIHYRLDGNVPGINDMLYSGPVSLAAPTIVSARAFKNGEPVGYIVTKTYSFLEKVATPVIEFSTKGGYFFGTCVVTATCDTEGATIRYMTTNIIPSMNSPVLPSEGLTLDAYSYIVVKAFKDGMTESDYVYKSVDVLEELADAQNIVTGDVKVGTPSQSAAWFSQSDTTYSSPTAMQACRTADVGDSKMVAKVSGIGKLTFYWKATSESNNSHLYFLIDGDFQNGITNSSWTRKEYRISEYGEHYLEWYYDKKYRNEDASGWVDDIVWTPLDADSLTSVVIDGTTMIACGDVKSYTCTAVWNDGDMTVVTPTWSLSDTTHATVDADGKVTNQNMTEADQTVTLTTSYAFGSVTKTATKVITLSRRTLTDIAIDGDGMIAVEGSASYTCSATWSYGDSTQVLPTWSLSSTAYATVDVDGNVMNLNTTERDQTVTLTASYMVGDDTKTAAKEITLKDHPFPRQMLKLHPGWNMVTLTKPLKNRLESVQKFLALRPISFDAEVNSMVVCNDATSIKIGIGYWVFSRQSQTVELVQDAEQPVFQVEMKQGWNFIGMTEDAAWTEFATIIWGWQNGRFIPMNNMENLQVGKAYWVYSDND